MEIALGRKKSWQTSQQTNERKNPTTEQMLKTKGEKNLNYKEKKAKKLIQSQELSHAGCCRHNNKK